MTPEELIAILKDEGRTLGATMSDEDWLAVSQPYVDALGHMTVDCIASAFLAWRRGEGEKNPLWATIFPRPDQVVRLAQPFWLQEKARQYRERRERESGRTFTAEERAAERQKMIDAGYLKLDGTPNLDLKVKEIPGISKPRLTPQQTAANLLAASGAQARAGGAPVSRRHIEADPGDVV
jgi:hypothetical protein